MRKAHNRRREELIAKGGKRVETVLDKKGVKLLERIKKQGKYESYGMVVKVAISYLNERSRRAKKLYGLILVREMKNAAKAA
jgi:hypothetical protein